MSVTHESLTERLELADALLAGRDRMFEPQDLPGRYGRVIKAVDHLLRAVGRMEMAQGAARTVDARLKHLAGLRVSTLAGCPA